MTAPARRRPPGGRLQRAAAVTAAVLMAHAPIALGTLPAPAAALTTAPAAAAAGGDSNRLDGSQSTFNKGKSSWDGNKDTALKQVSKPTERGAGALRLRNKTNNKATLVARSGTGPKSWERASPGSRWFGRVSIHAKGFPRNVRAAVRFLNQNGKEVGQAVGQPVRDKRRGWKKSWRTVGLAPKGTEYAVLRVSIAGTRSDEKHYLDNATLVRKPGGSPDVVGPLTTKGNRLLDGRGDKLVLRGFTRSGLEGVHWSPFTDSDIAAAKRWGANVIRIPIGEQFWRPTSCRYDPTYYRDVDRAVAKVTSRGMVAMLDLHWHTIENCGAVGQHKMADYPNAINFWKQIATRYGPNDLVTFDLYNEPHNISDAIWRNGGEVVEDGVTYDAAGMWQMYHSLRSTGADNVVFMSGNDWGNRFPTNAPITQATNVVYAAHVYTCPTDAPPKCENSAPYDPGQVLRNWVKPAKDVPVMVTEFGWPDPSNGRYIKKVIAFAEDHGWGWTAYTWGAETWGPFSLLATAGKGATYQPRPTGQAVLARLPGR